MSEFVDQLERELRAATSRRARLEAARMRRPRAGALAAIVSVGLCVAVVLAATQLHASRSARPRSGTEFAASQGVDPRIVASFGAFRRPRSASDALPAGLTFGFCAGAGPGHYAWCNNNPPGRYTGPGQPADAADHWRLEIFGKAHYLQVAESRRIPLPAQLGSLWLIPAGRWLCGFFDGPRWRNYFVRMSCGPISLILKSPPIDFPGYFFGSVAHGIMIGAEPDEIRSVLVAYPGGSGPVRLRRGAFAACVGQGPYMLEQKTVSGIELKPIRVGAFGSFRLVSCPELHISSH